MESYGTTCGTRVNELEGGLLGQDAEEATEDHMKLGEAVVARVRLQLNSCKQAVCVCVSLWVSGATVVSVCACFSDELEELEIY